MDVLILVLLGLALTLLGYRVIGPRRGVDPSTNPRHVGSDGVYRAAGAALILIGLLLAAGRLIGGR